MLKQIIITLTLTALLASCGGPVTKRTTLREIDITGTKENTTGRFVTPKSDTDIRKAYASYLRFASKNDKSRINALNRLAELEFELSEQILKQKDDDSGANGSEIEALDDQLYNAKLDRTIELLNTSLRDYPKAKGNDKTLYQLAKAYDQRGHFDLTHSTIENLVGKYPKSRYFIESKFRLAEDAFSSKKYVVAENLYTEIIGSKKSSFFFEKALYKRGWSRFKQEYYLEAVDDFLRVVNHNKFPEYNKLDKAKKNLFNEYFRAIGLSFSYLGGAEPLNDYFKDNSGFDHLYYTYAHVSDIYVKQERYNDAIRTLKYFAKFNKKSDHVPEALLKSIAIWEEGGFANKMNAALEPFYKKYHPDSQYWHKKTNINPRIYKLVKTKLREYMLTVTANLHKQYQLTKKQSDFKVTHKWYKNYLHHYKSHSRKDNIHYLFATLLSEQKYYESALKHYELAAYDSDIIINSDAAYESIILSSQLSRSSTDRKTISNWLRKLIHFSTLYSQQNTKDKRTVQIIAHASQLAYKNSMFKETVTLAELITGNTSSLFATNINTIKAHSYFKLAQYTDAENTYLAVLDDQTLTQKFRTPAINGLALAIYYQGKSAANEKEIRQAIKHYSRIALAAPSSSIAATGMYDAVALAMRNELWEQSIVTIKKFQRLYPGHKHSRDVAKKLSVAYLNSNQDIAAANELEKLTTQEDENSDFTIAALWKAGELYESKKEYRSAVRTFEKYALNYPRPFPQHMESMYKLVNIHKILKEEHKIIFWQDKIVGADKKATNLRTDRTKLIASSAALHLARNSHHTFTETRLVRPLKENLRKKKRAMQRAVNLYGRASSYGIAETATEATHEIAQIYNEFSKALLESERPDNLSADALEQYQILLEDQAFPFEEKAIEFYEINLSFVKDDIYDEWVKKSHTQLKQLFPVRYKREAKLERFINVLH